MAEKIRITFLGTGSMIPDEKRNHPAFLLSYKSENILVDCGEGTQIQFRKAKLNPCRITRILITHWHGDHTFGLPGLLRTLSTSGYHKKLYVYGPKKMKKHKIAPGKHIQELKQGKDITYNGKKYSAKNFVYGEKGKKVSFVLDTLFNP